LIAERGRPKSDQHRHLVTCALCGSSNHSTLYQNIDGYDISRCGDCGLTFVNPQPTAEELEEWYSGQRYFFIGAGESALEEYQRSDRYAATYVDRVMAIERYTAPGRLLDVGCAGGIFLDCARRRGWSVTGLELADWEIEVAQQRLGLDVRKGTLATANLEADSYDVVTYWDVLEHTRDPAGELARACRVLRSDGLLVIAVPNIDSLVARLNGRSWTMINPPEHLFYFSPQTLRRLLSANGFRIIDTHTVNGESSHTCLVLGMGMVGTASTSALASARRVVRRFGLFKRLGFAAARGLARTIASPIFHLIPRMGLGEGIICYASKNQR
jgi:2-polyprenyl-3-methyl-5-hydroxy-6-metoxy-1,4-benzoquinol methylase